MNLPGTPGGMNPRTNFRRSRGATATTGTTMPSDIALGTQIQNDALDRVENERRDRLNELAAMVASQGDAARADFQGLMERMMASPAAIQARQGQVAQRLQGQTSAFAGGSPLAQRLAAAGQRQVQAAAQQGGLQVAQAEEQTAIARLLAQIGNNQTDRARQFDNKSSLNRAADVESSFNAQGELALGELLRQAGFGRRQASVGAAAGQAQREQMRIQADREAALYQRQIQLQEQQIAAQAQQDQMILGGIQQFLASIGAQ